MKSKIYLAAIVAFTGTLIGQNNNTPWPPTGNVGIGTTSPSNKLEVMVNQPDKGITVSQIGASGAATLRLNTLNASGHAWSISSLGNQSAHGTGNFEIYDEGLATNPTNAPGVPPRFLISGATGNVGIALNNALLNDKLTVEVSSPGQGITIENNQNGQTQLRLKTAQGGCRSWALASLSSANPQGAGNFTIYDETAPGQSGDRFFINGSTGNIGIGSIHPNNNKLKIDASDVSGLNTNAIECIVNTTSQKIISGKNMANGFETFQVYGNGNTVINCTNTTPNQNHALVVCDGLNGGLKNFVVLRNGTVYAREIFVHLGIFPDYVFKKDYELMPLDKLESFIKENHHLPNVPSAEEVDKNGAGLGDLTKIQMEKIEELTLYILELKKEIDNLKESLSH